MGWSLSTKEVFMVLSWAAFYTIHSVLASSKLKRFLEDKWGISKKTYRLFYSLISSITFLGIGIQILYLPPKLIFETIGISEKLGYFMATLGVILGIRSFKHISVGEFLGLNSTPSPRADLIQSGLYAWTRHPMYFALFLIFLGYLGVSGTMGALIHLVCLIIYLPVGIYFEEKKMANEFGDAYRLYQKNVPVFFPIPIKKGPKPF